MSIRSRSSGLPRSSGLWRALAVRALATLAVAGGLAAAAPEPARAGSIGIIITDGDHRGHRGRGEWRRHRGDDRHHWRRHDHRRHDQRRHHHYRRYGPPPWAYHHYHRPYRPYVRTCHVVWSDWHRGFVQVCR